MYIEYPKCLYQRSGETVTVTNAEEEAMCVADGYMTAEQFHLPQTELKPESEEKKKKSK